MENVNLPEGLSPWYRAEASALARSDAFALAWDQVKKEIGYVTFTLAADRAHENALAHNATLADWKHREGAW